MNDFYTIISFPYLHEAAIAQGALQINGIECIIKDENITTANPLYSNAIGGIRLQVREADIEAALQILKEAGYETEVNNKSGFLFRFSQYTSKIPFLKNLLPEFRFLLVVGVITLILVVTLYFLELPK